MGCMLKFRSPSLYTITIVIKIWQGFLKKKERVKSFFIFMAMLSLKQVDCNHAKEDPWERDCSWIIKFSLCLNFGYRKYGIIFKTLVFSKWMYTLHTRKKDLRSEQLLILF